MENYKLEEFLKKGITEAVEDRAIMIKGALDEKSLCLAVNDSRRRGFPVIHSAGKLYLARSKKEFESAMAEEFRNNVLKGIIEYR